MHAKLELTSTASPSMVDDSSGLTADSEMAALEGAITFAAGLSSFLRFRQFEGSRCTTAPIAMKAGMQRTRV